MNVARAPTERQIPSPETVRVSPYVYARGKLYSKTFIRSRGVRRTEDVW